MLCSSKIKDQKPSSLKETGNLDTKTLPVFDIYQRQSSFKDQWVGILIFLQKFEEICIYASYESKKKKVIFPHKISI